MDRIRDSNNRLFLKDRCDLPGSRPFERIAMAPMCDRCLKSLNISPSEIVELRVGDLKCSRSKCEKRAKYGYFFIIQEEE